MDEAKENQGAEQPVALAGVNGVTHAPEAAAIKAVAEGTTTEDQASAEGPVAGEGEVAKEGEIGEAEAKEVPQEDPLLQAYSSQWEAAQAKPSDFGTWTTLISTADKLNDVEKQREVYDAFLVQYPLCYGYWKKYADAENRHKNTDMVASVYERGVKAFPYSVDLWGHYCTYLQSAEAPVPEIRGLYERGLTLVASDYLSKSLWNKYLAFEKSHGDAAKVAELYTRILGYPIADLDVFLQNLKEFIQERPVAEFASASELTSIKETLEADRPLAAAVAEPANGATPMETDGEAKPEAPPEAGGEAAAPKEIPDDQELAPGITQAVTDEEVKAAWLKAREAIHASTSEEVARITPFESLIKRPYFHVKPLDSAQLSAWDKYLNYVEEKGDADVAIRLYERCLVPCALYPEFWVRYVRFLEGRKLAAAREALNRATSIHCRLQPDLLLFAAHFEERHRKVAVARELYARVTNEAAPGLLPAVLAQANFERRQKKLEAACEAFEKTPAREDEKTADLWAMLYANFLRVACGDAAKARKVYADALAARPSSKALWEGAVHLEEFVPGADLAARVLEIYERAVAEPALAVDEREELSARAAAFADLAGSVQQLTAAERSHARLATAEWAQTQPASRKRGAEDAAGEDASKKQKAAASAEPSPAASPAPAASAPATAAASAAEAAAAAAYYSQGYYASGAYAYPGYGAYAGYPPAAGTPPAAAAAPAAPAAYAYPQAAAAGAPAVAGAAAYPAYAYQPAAAPPAGAPAAAAPYPGYAGYGYGY